MKSNIITLTISLLAIACAGTDHSRDDRTPDYATLDSWMKANLPDNDMVRRDDGFYLKITEGDPRGADIVKDSSVVAISYNIKSLDGNYIANTDSRTARRLGTYNSHTNYVPFAFLMTDYKSYNGITPAMYSALLDMRKGDTAEMYVTSEWAFGNVKVDSIYLGLTGNASLAANQIVHITMRLDSVQNMPHNAQHETIQKYIYDYFVTDYTLVRKGIYKKVLKEIVNPRDTMPMDTTVKIDYVGYLPNNFVFDTTLRDTAIAHHIYSSSTTYPPYSYEMKRRDTTDFANTIKAWKYVLETMKIGEEAIFIADSEYCYGDEGRYRQSATLMPVYTPLIFYMHVLTPSEASIRALGNE